ncbi:MAG: hypothetical protein AAGA87_16175 [Pseudomonadota bacterium]
MILAFHSTAPRWLRVFAIVSNVLFVVYGWQVGLWPIVLLHAILLPLNAVRLLEIGAPTVDTSRHAMSLLEKDELARDIRLTVDCFRYRRMNL